MRPVTRGENPTEDEFRDHKKARPYLIDQIGSYCSYCERRMSQSIDVEHIQPKRVYPGLYGAWDNYLLSCSNCNSVKQSKTFSFQDVVFPDRDNTGHAFAYTDNGFVEPSTGCTGAQKRCAQHMINLVGLNAKPTRRHGRVDQRLRARVRARDEREEYEVGMMSKEAIGRMAADKGFFSIWMDVFDNYPEVKRCIVDAYPGTAESCYDDDINTVSPRPITPDIQHLEGAGKV